MSWVSKKGKAFLQWAKRGVRLVEERSHARQKLGKGAVMLAKTMENQSLKAQGKSKNIRFGVEKMGWN